MNPTVDIDESILVCRCHSTQHQIVIRYDEEDNLVYCYIHLSGSNFWHRLKHGIKYIFGYRCKFGD